MTLPRLLLVDDEANILHALRRVLRKSNVDIDMTTSPHEALQLVQQHDYAVVVSDQRMPLMEGTKLLEQIRTYSPDAVRILLTGYADVQASIDAINRGAVYRYLTKPWDEAEIRNTLRQALDKFFLTQENRRLRALTEKQNAELRNLNENLKQKVMERTWEVMRLNQTLEQSFVSVVQAMARMAEMHSNVVGSHAKRVAQLAKQVARQLGLSSREQLQVEIGAMLHDIGKLRIDAAILQKPEPLLEAAERRILRAHPAQGEAIVRLVPHFEDAALFVRHHHERCDGTGYPDGLQGNQIPLGARIIAVADAYDNALNARTTFATMTPAEALGTVQQRDAHFDGRVLAALAEVVRALNGSAEHAAEIEVDLKDLRPGMVLARDLVSSRGVVLLKRHSMVLHDQITHLQEQHTTDPITDGIAVYRRWPPHPAATRQENAA